MTLSGESDSVYWSNVSPPSSGRDRNQHKADNMHNLVLTACLMLASCLAYKRDDAFL